MCEAPVDHWPLDWRSYICHLLHHSSHWLFKMSCAAPVRIPDQVIHVPEKMEALGRKLKHLLLFTFAWTYTFSRFWKPNFFCSIFLFQKNRLVVKFPLQMLCCLHQPPWPFRNYLWTDTPLRFLMCNSNSVSWLAK